MENSLPVLPLNSLSRVSGALALIGIVLFLLIYRTVLHRGRPPFPPGPKGLPVLGNIFDMPSKMEWKTYAQWSKKYGPIVSVHILGQRLVFLNTPELCRELLESRSALYMERPLSTMLDMMGYAKWLVGLLQPSKQWTTCRRLMAHNFNPQSVQKWRSYHLHEAHRLLVKLLDDPENFIRHVDRAVVGSLLLVLYGHRVPTSGEDPFVALHDKAVQDTGRALGAGAFLFNIFPGLRYIPEWMPGAGFQREAKQAVATSHKVLHEPVEIVKQKMAKGVVALSYVSSLLEVGEDEFAIKQTAATAYNAAIGGSKAIILSAILVMMLYPEAQRKAQQEIDKVTGGERLPGFRDRDTLPYVKAFIKELFRWITPAPIGLPRRLSRDDIVQGYFIPAGSVIMTNTWGIMHDESRTKDPLEFIPERYLDQDGNCAHPNLEGFGHGKRTCPGRYLIEELAWITIVSILAVLDIRTIVDENGEAVSPHVEYSPGVVRGPMPFESSITPRSQAAVDLIRGANDSLSHLP